MHSTSQNGRPLKGNLELYSHMTMLTYPWHNLSLSLLPPLHHFAIDLISHFSLNLSRVPREQRQETLGSTVDDIHFVEGDSVHHLLPLLQLSLGTLDKLCLQKDKVIVHAMNYYMILSSQ